MAQIDTLLRDYLNYLEIEKNRSPRTRANYERYLAAFLEMTGVRTVRDITPESVTKFRLALARTGNLKKNTQSYYVIALRNFLKYLIKRDFNALSPDKIELPRIPVRQIDILSYAEVERLLAAPKKSDLRSLRDKAILELLFSTGLRLAELCGLNRYHDWNKGELTVRGKGEKLRIVFLSDAAKTALARYLDARPDAEEALFVSLARTKQSRVIGRITARAVQRLVDAYARKAGIAKRVTPHHLRHVFATDLLANGADLRSVQELLGHASVATTQIYTHLTNRELKEVHRAFHGRRRSG